MDTLKIVIFDGSFKTTAFIRRLLKGLSEAGHEVFVLGYNESNTDPVKGVRYISLGDNSSNFRFVKSSLKWGFESKNFIKTVSHLLRGKKKELKWFNLEVVLNSIQPDLIHLQWVSNIPLFEDFLAKSTYKFVLSQRGFQTNVRPFVDMDNLLYLQKWLPFFKGFHSVSNAISIKADQIYSDDKKINQVVYTGLDMSKIPYNPEVSNHEILQIISVGRPHWVKGYDQALRAMKILKSKNINFEYNIIGAEGNEELSFLVDDLNLSECVNLFPKLPQDEVFKKVSKSSVMLMPSLEEGIANVAVEAMALGTPVISTDCGGMEELIESGREGWIIPVYDVDAMAESVSAFAKASPQEILRVKMAARKKVELQHNEDQMVDGMLKLYQKIQTVDI